MQRLFWFCWKKTLETNTDSKVWFTMFGNSFIILLNQSWPEKAGEEKVQDEPRTSFYPGGRPAAQCGHAGAPRQHAGHCSPQVEVSLIQPRYVPSVKVKEISGNSPLKATSWMMENKFFDYSRNLLRSCNVKTFSVNNFKVG